MWIALPVTEQRDFAAKRHEAHGQAPGNITLLVGAGDTGDQRSG